MKVRALVMCGKETSSGFIIVDAKSLMLHTHGKTAEVLANHLQKQLIYDLNEYITFLDIKRQSLLYT